jgi:PAS domain S-box-containing protein
MRLGLAVFEEEMQLEASGTVDPDRTRIMEVEEYKKDGSTIWVEVSLSFMRDKDGKPNEILIVTRDITERRQAAEELRRSETRLIEAQHITHTGNWELDIQSNILKWSDEIFNIFEIDKDRFGESYESFLSAIHPDDREIVNGAYTRSLETREPYEITHRLLMSDGRIKFVHEQCNTRFSAEGKPLISIGIIQDITVRKNSEEALQKSEAMYRSIIEASPDAITITNLEGQILFVSSPALKLYCIETEDELLGHVIFDFISPEDRERALSNVSLMFQGIMTGPAEYHGIRSDGSNFVLEANCEFILNAERQPDSMVFIARDITERKRSKEALMESEKKFRTIFESAGDSIFIMDGAAIADCNTKTLLMFGISMEEIIGHNPADFSPEYQPDGKSSAEKVMEKIDAAYDGNPQFFEWVHVRMDETQFSVDVNLTRILLDGRYHLQAILRDITKRKIREKEHSLLQTQLQQAQKMESIGRLAGGVAHDFNNMLGVILGQTELIMIDLPENDPIKDNLKIIRQAAENSVVLTRQLLAFARRQVVSPKELNLNEVVEGTIKMLRRLIGEDINLLWEPGNDLNQVLIDPGQVDQLLANLCVNARDAINGSGRITIETENVSFDDNYCAGHLGCQPGKYVMLSISDDGSGMTREVQERIFEPFYTTKGIGKGTGLGLATVYGIVKQNDGFISVYSEVGKGTSFKIYLKQTDVSPNCNMPVTEIETLQGQGETVLLVEDEIKLLELTRVMLEKIGYNVLTADTPGQAIELAENPENIIHILITDVIMPELNGRDLFNKIVKSRPGIKCLYMSGYTSDIIAHHGVLKEGVNFLPKPFSLKVLSVKLREVLDSVVNA